MQFRAFALAGMFGIVAATAAQAQVVTVGSTKGGVLAAVVTGTAKIISENAGVQMRTEKLGGTQQYIPMVNAGEIDFGVSNAVQYEMALTGTGISKRKYPNLRFVAKMMTFRTGPIVPGASGITDLKQIKGKRVPYGFKAAPLFQMIFTAYLTNAGLTWNDVTKVPVVGLRQNWDAFEQGKTDLSIGNPGSGVNKKLMTTVKGGILHLSLYTDTPGAKQILKDVPGMFYLRVDPNKNFPGVKKPVQEMAYPFILWAGKQVKDDVVYRVVKTMYEKEADFKALGPVWASYFAKDMTKSLAGTAHPGAIKFYKEVGLWKK